MELLQQLEAVRELKLQMHSKRDDFQQCIEHSPGLALEHRWNQKSCEGREGEVTHDLCHLADFRLPLIDILWKFLVPSHINRPLYVSSKADVILESCFDSATFTKCPFTLSINLV